MGNRIRTIRALFIPCTFITILSLAASLGCNTKKEEGRSEAKQAELQKELDMVKNELSELKKQKEEEQQYRAYCPKCGKKFKHPFYSLDLSTGRQVAYCDECAYPRVRLQLLPR